MDAERKGARRLRPAVLPKEELASGRRSFETPVEKTGRREGTACCGQEPRVRRGESPLILHGSRWSGSACDSAHPLGVRGAFSTDGAIPLRISTDTSPPSWLNLVQLSERSERRKETRGISLSASLKRHASRFRHNSSACSSAQVASRRKRAKGEQLTIEGRARSKSRAARSTTH